MMSGISSAIEGVRAHLEAFNRTADRIARFEQGRDPARDGVQMLIEKRGLQIQLKTIKVADEMSGSLIDILA